MRYRAPRSRARVTRVRVSVRGRRARSPCAARGELRCAGRWHCARGSAATRAVVVGRGRYAIRAGRRATVRVRLSARARRALASRAAGGHRAKVGTRHQSGAVLGSRRAVVLVAPLDVPAPGLRGYGVRLPGRAARHHPADAALHDLPGGVRLLGADGHRDIRDLRDRGDRGAAAVRAPVGSDRAAARVAAGGGALGARARSCSC